MKTLIVLLALGLGACSASHDSPSTEPKTKQDQDNGKNKEDSDGGNDGTTPPSKVSFSILKSKVLQSRCFQCHSGSNPKGFIRLETEDDFLRANLIDARSPEQSEILKIVNPTGGFMPPRNPLLEKEFEVFREYLLGLKE